jgi:hypothetical protein
MEAVDAQRLELYELLKPKLDEEPARALVLALPPEPDTLLRKDDLTRAFESFDAKMDARFAQIDGRFAQIDVRFAQVDVRFAQVEALFARMESTLTRRMVTIMGAWTILLSSALGWAPVLLR